jgi:hypothetical protein
VCPLELLLRDGRAAGHDGGSRNRQKHPFRKQTHDSSYVPLNIAGDRLRITAFKH